MRPRRQFDVTELLVITGVTTALAVAFTLWRYGAFSPLDEMASVSRAMTELELAELLERYGPEHASQFAEEWIVRDYFQDRQGGVFLDVGANHYRNHSTTYTLETRLGWSGLAIDAQDRYRADYLEHRPRTTFLAAFVSDVDDERQTLYIPKGRPLNASGEKPADPADERQVPTVTLNRALKDANLERVDFMNLDIEGFEGKALAGFDIARYRPALICIESHREGRQATINYMDRHGYVLVGKYLRADPLNLYFRPAEAAPSVSAYTGT